MNVETKAALLHFLAHEGRPVAEALRAEAAQSTLKAEYFREMGDDGCQDGDYWRNDRWQTAWRELFVVGGPAFGRAGDDVFWEAGYRGADYAFYVTPLHKQMLTGEVLADALRDIALSGALEENNAKSDN